MEGAGESESGPLRAGAGFFKKYVVVGDKYMGGWAETGRLRMGQWEDAGGAKGGVSVVFGTPPVFLPRAQPTHRPNPSTDPSIHPTTLP